MTRRNPWADPETRANILRGIRLAAKKRWRKPEQPVEYCGQTDFARSLDEGYRAIRERVAKGGPGWVPKEPAE